MIMMKRVALFILVAFITWVVSTPQLVILTLSPAYQALFGISPDAWVANVIWTPLAGIPASAAVTFGAPRVVNILCLIWAIALLPLAAASLALRWAFYYPHPKLLCAWAATWLLNVPIPLSVPALLGYWWCTY